MPDLASPFGAIKLTELGADQENSSAKSIKGRERQFLLLLQRNDTISRQVCAAMLPKVDLQFLRSQGLIWVENEDKSLSEFQFQPQSKSEPQSPRCVMTTDISGQATSPAPLSSNEDACDADPMLLLAAGMV